MELLRIINQNLSEWKEIMTSPPYNLRVNQKDDYFLLKYNIKKSDMELKACQEARGVIIKFDRDRDEMICVCRGFDKFFNFGEKYAAQIDWDTAITFEKIDGSLIRFWYDSGEWRVSTNSCVDANDAGVMGLDKTFADLVYEVFDRDEGIIKEFYSLLDKEKTYVFELTSKFNKLVVDYGTEPTLYYLGERNNKIGQEYYNPYPFNDFEYVSFIKNWEIGNLIEAIKLCNEFSNFEGFVVVDKNFNRIKIKGEAYLESFKMRANELPSSKTFISCLQNDNLDDFLAYNPQYENEYEEFMKKFNSLAYFMERNWKIVENNNLETRKEKAELIKTLDCKCQSYCFFRLSNNLPADGFMLEKLTTKKLINFLEGDRE